jgi:drug/metabolite transporter (DMT)-like permease
LRLLGLLFLAGRARELRRAPWRDVALLGVLGAAAPAFLLVVGQNRSDAVTVAIVSTTLPLISAAMVRLRGCSDLAISGLTFLAGAAIVAVVIALALPLRLAVPRFDLAPPVLALLVWMSMIAIGLSVLLWFTCARLLGITVAAIHTSLAPFYVMLIALAFGGSVAWQQATGATLLVAGAFLAQLASLRRR